jgi:tetratricopeptide (TPR) repeat protein
MTDRPTGEAETPAAPAVDWAELVARGRYDLAAQTYRLTGGTDELLRANLESLADAQMAARDKAWRRVAKALERVEQRHDALPWPAVDRDVEALQEASAALDVRESDQARAHLARADGSGFPAEAATLMGTLAVFEGDNERARERFEAALELDPNHFRALTNLGNLKLEEDDVDGAIDAYERAIRLNDTFANAHHNLGVAYRRQGQVSKSVRALRRAQREGSKRDVEDARARIGTGKARSPGSARTVRWIVIAVIAVAAFWFFGGRTP